MRKTLFLSMLCASAASQALVLPVPFFATPAPLREDFDSTASGNYVATPAFTLPAIGTAYALNPPGTMYVGIPFGPPAFSPPHSLVGQGTDVGIRVVPSMRRFGGYFRASPNAAGIAPTAVRFRFYSASNVLLGIQTVPLTSTWTWRGFLTVPQLWQRVEIYGNIPGSPGGVEMDNLRIRPF